MDKVKAVARKAWRGFSAAVTSPEAVKHERSLAVLVATRVLLAVGASDALIQLAAKIIGG